jgi:hypothetical protein
MSDFLTRLARRCLGEPPGIRPRLPGLFGPADEGPSVTATNTAAVADAPQGRGAPSPSLRSGAMPRAKLVSNELQDALAGPPRQPEPSAPPAEEPFPIISRPQEDTSGNLIANMESTSGKTLAPASLGTQSAFVAAASWHSSSEPFERNPRATVPDPCPPLVPQRPANAVASPLATADRPAAAVNRAVAEPAVHITIGRIDVRAVTATAPPAPRPSARNTPALSLDDYLKRGGGRR